MQYSRYITGTCFLSKNFFFDRLTAVLDLGALNAPKKKSKNRIASLRAAISLGHNAQGTHPNGWCCSPGSPSSSTCPGSPRAATWQSTERPTKRSTPTQRCRRGRHTRCDSRLPEKAITEMNVPERSECILLSEYSPVRQNTARSPYKLM